MSKQVYVCWFLLKVLTGLFLGACDTKVSSAHKVPPPYYDLRSYLARQAQLLSESKASCRKTMQLNKVKQDTLLREDSSGWMKEWSHLLRLDLNQPSNHNLYDSLSKKVGTLRLLRYRPKSLPHSITNKVKVQALDLYFDSLGELVSLKGSYREHKYLYTQVSELYASFKAHRMLTYELKGYQKLIQQDTIRYHVVWTYPESQ